MIEKTMKEERGRGEEQWHKHLGEFGGKYFSNVMGSARWRNLGNQEPNLQRFVRLLGFEPGSGTKTPNCFPFRFMPRGHLLLCCIGSLCSSCMMCDVGEEKDINI